MIIADIRLPDMTGYELMLKLQEIAGHGAAGADDRLRLRPGPLDRQGPAGRPASGVLYKPFRLDQLLDTVERAIAMPRPVQQAT